MRYPSLFAHEGCLAVVFVDVYSNVDCHLYCFTSVSFSGWLERGNHLFARLGAFMGPLQKSAHSHTRPFPGQYHFGLTNHRELTRTQLETFHPFTHDNQPNGPILIDRSRIHLLERPNWHSARRTD